MAYYLIHESPRPKRQSDGKCLLKSMKLHFCYLQVLHQVQVHMSVKAKGLTSDKSVHIQPPVTAGTGLFTWGKIQGISKRPSHLVLFGFI